jgi:hypothetical protein
VGEFTGLLATRMKGGDPNRHHKPAALCRHALSEQGQTRIADLTVLSPRSGRGSGKNAKAPACETKSYEPRISCGKHNFPNARSRTVRKSRRNDLSQDKTSSQDISASSPANCQLQLRTANFELRVCPGLPACLEIDTRNSTLRI